MAEQTCPVWRRNTELRRPWWRADHGAARCGGFTLIEILVALALLAFTFAMAYHVLSAGLSWSDRGRAAQEATMVAETLLERVGHDIALADGEVAGRTGNGFAWRLAMTPYQLAGGASQSLAAHQVEVTVSWLDRRRPQQIRIVTLRLALPEGGS